MRRTSAGNRIRLAAAAGIAGLMVFSAPAAATAAPETPVTGKVGTGHGPSYTLVGKDGSTPEAGVITLQIGDKTADAYCIDLKDPLKRHAIYQETAWTDSAVNNLGRIQWILQHSTPQVAAADVVSAAKVDLRRPTDGDQLDALVYAATQGAIWHFSDGFELADVAARGGERAIIRSVYAYLVGQASDESEPAPTLRITPQTATASTGRKAGPFTVTSATAATLKATGGTIVDDKGTEITGSLGDGRKFWLTSDKNGKVQVDATATGTVPTGRVFTLPDAPDKAQKIILAGAATAPLAAHASATFGAAGSSPSASGSPAPTLPITGAPVAAVTVTALVLLAIGGGLVFVLRRRRVKFTA